MYRFVHVSILAVVLIGKQSLSVFNIVESNEYKISSNGRAATLVERLILRKNIEIITLHNIFT